MNHFAPWYLPLATDLCHMTPLCKLSSGLQDGSRILRKASQVGFDDHQVKQMASHPNLQIEA